jgi:hypothetical protein
LVGLGATTYGMLATFVKWHTLKIIQQLRLPPQFIHHRNIIANQFIPKNKKNKNTAKQLLAIFSPINASELS